MNILLVTPPFSQLNTPYPATPYLTGFLESKGFNVEQCDLGIEVINNIFSKDGLTRIFNIPVKGRVGALKYSYINTIESVMLYLQNKNPTLENLIKTAYLPQGDRFNTLDDQSTPREMATAYINDISDYIKQYIDPDFGVTRYSETLGIGIKSFDTLEKKLESNSIILDFIKESWIHTLKDKKLDLIGITIPFPGNLFTALYLAKLTKEISPGTKIVFGGGWVNTELRNLTDSQIFKYTDYITLDNGEVPLEMLLLHLRDSQNPLHRTYVLENGKVVYKTQNNLNDYKLDDLPPPSYKGLKLDSYISIADGTNSMHNLWSNGRWNKLTLANGCYWHKCAFCDVTLPYINCYSPSSPQIIVDKIEKIIHETSERGFHFVDEAAPPALLRDLALELLRRNISITWWTNIRFEKTFTLGLTQLLAKSGCIAVSGGIEVASDRLLAHMKKGVTVEQVTRVTSNFKSAQIMVHGYLMYGFPGQTQEEIIDALEVVRQLFQNKNIDSAYWHQFSLTAHSGVAQNNKDYEVQIDTSGFRGFSLNDLPYKHKNFDPGKFSVGLKTSLYNYMRGIGFDLPLNSWFNFTVPKTRVKRHFLSNILPESIEIHPKTKLIWLGEDCNYSNGELFIYDNIGQEKIKVSENQGLFTQKIMSLAKYTNKDNLTINDVDIISREYNIDTDSWLSGEIASLLYTYGLVLI